LRAQECELPARQPAAKAGAASWETREQFREKEYKPKTPIPSKIHVGHAVMGCCDAVMGML